MVISGRAMRGYAAAVNAVADRAESEAESAYDAMRRADPNASVAEVREAVKAIVEDSMAAYADAASEVAASMYDELARMCGAEVDEAEIYGPDGDAGRAIDRWARYAVSVLATDREDI